MSRLFWKIFLGFWLVMVLMVTATVMITPDRGGPIHRQLVKERKNALSLYTETAESMLNSGGLQAFERWRERVEGRSRVRLLLFDEQELEITGRTPPQSPDNPEAKGWHDYRDKIRLINLDTAEGKYALGLLGPRWIKSAHTKLGRRALAVPLLIAMVISGIVCFLLARHFSKPLKQLQLAAQQLAEGDLQVRVGKTMSNRQDEFGRLGKDFDHMAEQLDILMQARNRLLGDISHELRSPLARLQLALELARKRSEGKAETELNRIELEATRLNNMIGQILSLTRLESGPEKVAKQSVAFNSLLQDVVADAQFEADQGKRIETFSSPSIKINADAVLIKSALENVIRNALAHTAPESAVEIAFAQESDEADNLKIKVRDHGSGVPESALPHLFDPFYRVGEARDRATGGYGLGLAIAKRAVAAHGGEVSASNHPDGGLEIVIVLPVL